MDANIAQPYRIWFYLIVALHSVDECLVCHNLCVSIEEGLETVIGLSELLLGDLWKQGHIEQWFSTSSRSMIYSVFEPRTTI